jgi:hypothetical protein
MTAEDIPPALRKRRRWPLLLIVPLALLMAGFVYLHLANQRLERAIAEADRLDPRWRLADIEADRATLPDEENSALTVSAARAKLPPNGLGSAGISTISLLAKHGRPTQKQLADVRADLAPAADAIALARKLADQPRGRRPSTAVPVFDAVDVAKLLAADAQLRVWESDFDGALASCRAMLNAGRSMGDEPTLIAQLVCLAIGTLTANQAEIVLGQGEPSEAALAGLQELVADECQVPHFTIGIRGERARCDELLESVQRGDTTVKRMFAGRGQPAPPRLALDANNLLYLPGVVASGRAVTLEQMTQLVEITKLPPHERASAVASLREFPRAQSIISRFNSPLALARYVEDALENQTRLRCVLPALAVERYRLKYHRWPDSLSAVVPEFLPELPTDPFDGKPLRYRRDSEGIIVYSVGPDRTDDGGDRQKFNSVGPGRDIGFRLSDVDRRR